MRTKRFYSILLLTLLSMLSLSAQTVDQIRSSNAYIYGEGYATTVSRADEMALAQLTSQIVVTINSETTSVDTEYVDQSGNTSNESEFNTTITSYTNSTLTNTQRIIITNEPEARVFRYIKKSEIDRIFESRKQKVQELVRLGEKAESSRNVDNALKYYYWAFNMLKSLRYPSELYFTDANGTEQHLITWLPQELNEIFNNIDLYLVTDMGDGLYELAVKYKGVNANSFDFTYFDGVDWSGIYSANNGKSVIELRPGVQPVNLKIKCEYVFENEIHMDREIESVMELTEPVIFPDAYITIGSHEMAEKATQTQTVPTTNSQAAISSSSTLEQTMLEKAEMLDVYDIKVAGKEVALSKTREVKTYTDIVDDILVAVKGRNYSSVKGYFTAEGYDIFDRLIHYGNAVVVGEPEYKCVSVGDEVDCRGVAMSFNFNNNNRQFVENISFSFDSENRISDICFCLDHEAEKDIVAMSQWSEGSRYQIVSFLENYKTAYALKRADYLDTIFDDNALIITGRVVYRTTPTESGINYQNKYTELTRQSKTQYISGLRRVFASNEYVNLKFADSKVMKLGAGGEIYGIQLKQDYYSSNYADTGYLFLMVDLNDASKPTIHVRTWQEDVDPEFGIIGPEHF